MNVKLLRKIQKHILAEPKRYDQARWIERNVAGRGAPACRTVACIAGWACELSGVKAEDWQDVFKKAAKLLELDQMQANKLFTLPMLEYPWYWPTRFTKLFNKARSKKGRAAAAAKRIDHFIKTKGAE